jgi:monoamine oxidase
MDADVIVIGAGAAGLAAARELAGRSLNAIVVEARDRIGGRVLTQPTARAMVPAELGAEFIHGPAAETKALLREAGTTAIETGGEGWVCDANGELQPEERDFGVSAGIFERVRSLPHDESVAVFLARFAGDPAMGPTVAEALSFAEGFDAVDPAIASALGIADEWGSGVDATSARPIGGYPPMFEHLRAACIAAGARIELSSAVRRVAWARGSVTVEVQSATGETRTLRARAAIVTLPAGVLQHRGDTAAVTFEPDLPAAKRDALRHIPMGDVVKVVLEFRTAFWERVHDERYREASFFRRGSGPFPAYWLQYPVHSELVTAWAGGPRAIAMRDVPQTERIERALQGFGALLDAPVLARAEFVRGFTHDWLNDPFARGAYTYIAVGGGDARLVLAAPLDGTLFFAGEATSNDGQGGTVNGALESGERAAREAAASLSGAQHG